MKDPDIVNIIDDAIHSLKNEDRPLQSGASERSFAHRLAVHMEGFFEGWNVDCEYNRQGMITKELEGIAECKEQRATDRIYPDVIVHHRTNSNLSTEGENLLAIELKNDDKEDVCDKRKLELLTSSEGYYKYQLGLYININNNQFIKTWYKDGEQVSEEVLFT